MKEKEVKRRKKRWRKRARGRVGQKSFLPSSIVVIRDEYIVDIDLPCRTEPAHSFIQCSFIMLACYTHTHTHTNTWIHSPQRSPAGTEALPE